MNCSSWKEYDYFNTNLCVYLKGKLLYGLAYGRKTL